MRVPQRQGDSGRWLCSMLLGVMARSESDGQAGRILAHVSEARDGAHAAVPERRGRGRAWTLLLVLPYAGLCFPQMYVRLTPVLWGFPFFYWYQFAWVLLTSAMLGLVYKMQKQS